MLPINLHFHRLQDIRLDILAERAIGVYVLYSGKAKVNPTKIGEGVILDRFYAHLHDKRKILAKPINGYMAIIGFGHKRNFKIDAEIAECALFDIAEYLDKNPLYSTNPRFETIKQNINSHNKIKIYFSGFDPFTHRKISNKKYFEYYEHNGDIFNYHNWNKK
jgi:hypothetical protein